MEQQGRGRMAGRDTLPVLIMAAAAAVGQQLRDKLAVHPRVVTAGLD
jgi:hypothetical protein